MSTINSRILSVHMVSPLGDLATFVVGSIQSRAVKTYMIAGTASSGRVRQTTICVLISLQRGLEFTIFQISGWGTLGRP